MLPPPRQGSGPRDFTLREIEELLALTIDPDCSRAKVRERAVAKVEDIDARIKELKRMKRALAPLIVACDGKGALEGCPILVAMDSGAPSVSTTKTPRKQRK
jgi:MerR family transcriptional regulator, copper efflux regulator